MRRAVRPSMPELQQHLSIRCQMDPILRVRWTERVASDALEVFSRARPHLHGRIEIEATKGSMIRSPRHRQRRLVRDILKPNSGILSAYYAATGKPHYELQRLEGVPNVFASPVAAGGRVYIAGSSSMPVDAWLEFDDAGWRRGNGSPRAAR
jgi:hypothetical protein